MIVSRIIHVEVLLAFCCIVRARLQYTYNYSLLHRQIECLANDTGIPTKRTSPVVMRQDSYRLDTLILIFGNQRASEERIHTENLEEVRCDEATGRSMWFTSFQNVERPIPELHKLFDGLRCLSVICDLGK